MSEPVSTSAPGAKLDTLEAAHRWLQRDGRVALATVVHTWGSAPVPVGGQMAVNAEGEFQGSVSGGCIEGDVIVEAEDVLDTGKPRTLTFGVADETAWNAGLPCGGEVKIFLERLESSTGGLALLESAVSARRSRRGLVVRTDLGDGRRETFSRDSPDIPADIARRLSSGKSSLVESADRTVFIHALLPPARIVVIGATHIAQLFTRIAKLAEYEVVIIDPRTAFASAARFPDTDIRAEWPQDALPRIGLDAYTALVVVAHVSHIDDEALKVGLRSECLYIGALGSNRNHTKRKARLEAAGFTGTQIARIKNPIGLDIGAQSPAEIAVAIMAEVVLAVRGAKGGSRQ